MQHLTQTGFYLPLSASWKTWTQCIQAWAADNSVEFNFGNWNAHHVFSHALIEFFLSERRILSMEFFLLNWSFPSAASNHCYVEIFNFLPMADVFFCHNCPMNVFFLLVCYASWYCVRGMHASPYVILASFLVPQCSEFWEELFNVQFWVSGHLRCIFTSMATRSVWYFSSLEGPVLVH